MLPTDNVIAAPWALSAVRSSHVICCCSGKLPGQRLGNPLLPARSFCIFHVSIILFHDSAPLQCCCC